MGAVGGDNEVCEQTGVVGGCYRVQLDGHYGVQQ